MSCKEALPIRNSVERHKHLLEGNMPFTVVNDHKALTYVLDGPAKHCVVSVAARDRLCRWAEYLRSFSFNTVHIPGDDNHFCDLLSRNGCNTLVSSWRGVKHGDVRNGRSQHDTTTEGTGDMHPVSSRAVSERAHPQLAIITPAAMPKAQMHSTKDLDISGPDLMPDIPHTEWPTPQRIHEARQRADIITRPVHRHIRVGTHVHR